MTKQLTPLRRKDREAGYQAAVKEIVAWLKSKDQWGPCGPAFIADQIEAKFGNSNVAD